MHDLGYVHNDIKLDNILIGYKDPSLLYLIDFGLTCKYLDEDGQHVQKKFLKKFEKMIDNRNTLWNTGVR